MEIKKIELHQLGLGFVQDQYLNKDETEYSVRFSQQVNTRKYRNVTAEEKAALLANANYVADWDQLWVTDSFIADQVQNSKFYGLVRIGEMKSICLEYRDLVLATGIYNSTIISTDLGDCVAIHHVRYLSHYIIGNEVILSSINEMETSPVAKFGNGIVKEGEDESNRIVLEVCNENGGRAIIPFDGMQASDAYLWTRFRADKLLQQRFKEMTEKQFSAKRGYYSVIGDNTVIENSNIIKDVKIGSHAYIKGVNKLKNVTINSIKEAYTQIGEGCEIVNGIMGYGCRVFYGVKAVRFVLSSFSQLKYGARLINSFLGDNSTISCCEVLNSLIFPAHEQHHNNSFLCAALIKGQSNMAAGATVGSNHNSRAADGEIVAGRGFWPGLCVSLKHNSMFASYTLIVKGDFLHELNVNMPFSLVSHDVVNNSLVIIPAYWFMYNMYALMRNTNKFQSRDRRTLKNQAFEYNVLGPDTVNEMFDGMREIAYAVGKAYGASDITDEGQYVELGKDCLENDQFDIAKTIYSERIEASKRSVILAKPKEAYAVYRRMIEYYAGTLVLNYLQQASVEDLLSFIHAIKDVKRSQFENIGSQLVPQKDYDQLILDIKEQTLQSWHEVHQRFHTLSDAYESEKLLHAIASYAELMDISFEDWDATVIAKLITRTQETKYWIKKEIYRSRAKDYSNPFKSMVYSSYEEMEEVIGALADNPFIKSQEKEMEIFDEHVKSVLQKYPIA